MPKDQRYGWKKERFYGTHPRDGSYTVGTMKDYTSPVAYRVSLETAALSGMHGYGWCGADFWPVLKNRRGRRMGRIYARHPEGNWRSNDICTALLAPGPKGPVATHRYEMLREGVQECEARIFIERALTDKTLRRKMDAKLAKRAQVVLDERTCFMIKGMSDLKIDSSITGWATNAYSTWWNRPGIEGHKWFVASGWQERSRKLFSLAGEVARKLAPGGQ